MPIAKALPNIFEPPEPMTKPQPDNQDKEDKQHDITAENAPRQTATDDKAEDHKVEDRKEDKDETEDADKVAEQDMDKTMDKDGHEGKGGQVGKDGQEPEEGKPEHGEPEARTPQDITSEQESARVQSQVECYALARRDIVEGLKKRMKRAYPPAFSSSSTLGLSDHDLE